MERGVNCKSRFLEKARDSGNLGQKRVDFSFYRSRVNYSIVTGKKAQFVGLQTGTEMGLVCKDNVVLTRFHLFFSRN